ncbi:Histone acetyltransferase type B, catalytic subunit [Trema orientale]|uniref:Histone acetyltransferase type B, catalytic subunit n=1 Tax=Trema orientale TaxID=63057 RepID=A0A2P5CU39_TREOI|nr:Histone acetyltransferase type B, catalytic subunit [Trema orientale]
MARRKAASSAPSPSPISIGNCEVRVEASKYNCESNGSDLQISISRNVKIKISVREDANAKKNHEDDAGQVEREERDASHGGEFSFVLVNPKDLNNSGRSYLQEVLKMYTTELPEMNYAANTGKQSMFLEKCVMNGKYCTLLLKSMSVGGLGEVIAAITYQIVPADTQYAEIPLAAVSSAYQQKGFGRLLFVELRKRLQSVGICSILCWGDKESEGFWHKQGFVSVAEVDVKGRARRLPIKTDIRKALSFPGGSTLMVSHLKQEVSALSADSLKLTFPLQPNGKPSSTATEIPPFGVPMEGSNTLITLKQNTPRTDISPPELLVNDELPGEDKKLQGSQFLDEMQGYTESLPFSRREPNKAVCVRELFKTGVDADGKHCSCSTQGSGAKRIWEASLSSLKSKKVKGSHLVGCQSEPIWDLVLESSRDGSSYQTCPLAASENKSLQGLPPKNFSSSCMEKIAEGCAPCNTTSEACVRKEVNSHRECFKIILMNIADDKKKAHLGKVIADLGGIITSDGRTSTHVITGKVRKTLNFCTALCSGAWIVSPCWLKECFRQGKFIDELPYVLNDEDYVLKYRAELRSAVLRAKDSPGGLLKGYDVCMATHVEPSAKCLSAIVSSAGANVINRLSQVKEASKTIFVACEEDMEEAILAAKKGVWTFSSDWLMNCIMRQELDLEAPQFAESL